MNVARVTEIIASSKDSFDDAIKTGLARANKTIENIKSAWIKDQSVEVQNGKISQYRVILMVTFLLKD